LTPLVFRRLRPKQFLDRLGDSQLNRGVERVSDELDDTVGTLDWDVLEMMESDLSGRFRRSRQLLFEKPAGLFGFR
jgi:hypothetical protein